MPEATFDVLGYGPTTKVAREDAIDVLAQLTAGDDRIWRITSELYKCHPGNKPDAFVWCQMFVEVDERKTAEARTMAAVAAREHADGQ